MVFFSVRSFYPGLWAQKELRVQEVLHLQANHQQWALCRTECNLPRQQNPELLGFYVSNLRFKIPVFVLHQQGTYTRLIQCLETQRQEATIYGFHLASSSMPKSGGHIRPQGPRNSICPPLRKRHCLQWPTYLTSVWVVFSRWAQVFPPKKNPTLYKSFRKKKRPTHPSKKKIISGPRIRLKHMKLAMLDPSSQTLSNKQ